MASDNGDRGPTQRVVLKRVTVLVLPEGVEVTVERMKGIANSLGLKPATRFDVGEAWTVVGEYEGASKTHAIEAHAGKPGTADAKPGAYKAPSKSSWAGGELYVKPDQPKVERQALEDA